MKPEQIPSELAAEMLKAAWPGGIDGMKRAAEVALKWAEGRK